MAFTFTLGGRGRGGFGPRGGCFGPRFGHPGHGHGPVFPHRRGHQHGPFWHPFHEADNIVLAFVDETSSDEERKERTPKHCKRATCTKQVKKTPIDPVWTVVETKDGKFTVSMPLGKDAQAEDVKLSIKDRDLYVEIKLEKSSEDGTSHLRQVFTKKITLPENVKVEDIRSCLTPEGVLTIEAPVNLPEIINIPVNMADTTMEPSAPADN